MVPLTVLQTQFGAVEYVSVVTLQVILGGGYPGVNSMDILDHRALYFGGRGQAGDISKQIVGVAERGGDSV